MIVICDTSPLCYLLLIGQIEILPQLFGRIIIPNAVQEELLNENADPIIKNWISQPPSWLEIQIVERLLSDLPSKLGSGECEAISLAVELKANLLIMDDWDARQAAISRGFTVIGLLGILYRAGVKNLLDFPNVIFQLQSTTFRASPDLIESFLNRYTKEKLE